MAHARTPCSRQLLLAALPRTGHDLCIRALARRDLDTVAAWPGYPPGHETYDLRFAAMSAAQRDELFTERQAEPSRITLVADHANHPCIGYLGLIRIDWRKRMIGNMGYRIHPDWCDRGLGTQVMRMAAAWCFDGGIETLQLDVAAANPRAIRCYQKAGFVITGEFWQPEPDLRNADLDNPRYDTLRPHVRQDGPMPRVRFYWMRRTAGH